ncbi:EamA family transporter [Noviherbaspirillum aerium]|uniref:EamA family transporter n=1 Tax=Noviherbaspirillum aerium TaxID=2588497 RepID=UPI00178C2BB4|nr:EamA family transporter [Noviherbaspirillum aerium]
MPGIVFLGDTSRTVFRTCAALALQVPISFSLSKAYLGSLAYLVLAASVCAFLLYFELIRRIGPARASFSFVLVPIVAIAISVMFEGLPLSGYLIIGAITALVGNLFILSQRVKPSEVKKTV